MKLISFTLLGALCQAMTCVAGILPTPTIPQSATPFNASYVGANLFDSVVTSEYASQSKGAGAAYSTTLGTWLQFDFGAPVTMDRVLLMTRGNALDVIGNYRMILAMTPPSMLRTLCLHLVRLDPVCRHPSNHSPRQLHVTFVGRSPPRRAVQRILVVLKCGFSMLQRVARSFPQSPLMPVPRRSMDLMPWRIR